MSVMENPAGLATGEALDGSDCTSVSSENSHCSRGPQPIRVELSERRRQSGDTIPVASCLLAEVEGSAAPICALARKLLDLGVEPTSSGKLRQPFRIGPVGLVYRP